MRNIIKYFTGITYKPLMVKYLSKTRRYTYKGIRLLIPAEVFHPGFFFSTKILLDYTRKLQLTGKTFLELGAGSGLIAISAAKKNAKVTATDINPVAVEFLYKNALENNVELNVIQSDLFQQIPLQHFDFIIINPPYYKKDPETYKDYAWCCGAHGGYFDKLFASIADYMKTDTKVFMVLYDGCDFKMINDYAKKNDINLNCLLSKQNLLEKNFVYQIEVR